MRILLRSQFFTFIPSVNKLPVLHGGRETFPVIGDSEAIGVRSVFLYNFGVKGRLDEGSPTQLSSVNLTSYLLGAEESPTSADKQS